MKPIIEVQNLSKKYQINAQQQRYLSLRDIFTDIFKFNKNKSKEDFWALKDIDFKVEAGESVGIIGRNGAGKSTLLKILSRITPPTKGRVKLRGRIASLLEVGTGFHPELTGRENVYFNGSILGLRKAEIDKRFDEIVDFSGVEQFIDTPLKHYSSGMQLRLAFAVAAHLEPEILVIDEVLAVGDAEFQKKCLGKMGEVSQSGRTVLFVSHNLGAVQKLCERGIVLQNGKIVKDDTIYKAVEQYLKIEQESNIAEYFFTRKNEVGFTKLTFLNSKKEKTAKFLFGEPFEIELEIESSIELLGATIVIGIDNQFNERICTCVSDQVGILYNIVSEKRNLVKGLFKDLILHPGSYQVYISLRTGFTALLSVQNAGVFTISDVSVQQIVPYSGHWGIFRYNPQWY